MECLGPGQLLGPDPHTIFFERSSGINSNTVDRDVGDGWNSLPAESSTFALFGGMPSPFLSALDEFRCSLRVRTARGFGTSLSNPAIPPLGSGTIRCLGNKYRSLDRRHRGYLGRIPGAWPFLRRDGVRKHTFTANIFNRPIDSDVVFRCRGRGTRNGRDRTARKRVALPDRGGRRAGPYLDVRRGQTLHLF